MLLSSIAAAAALGLGEFKPRFPLAKLASNGATHFYGYRRITQAISLLTLQINRSQLTVIIFDLL